MKNTSIRYLHFTTIDSTSTWIKNNITTLDQQGITCVTAEEQTAGRGRFNRVWHSPKEKNLYASLFFTLNKEALFLQNLSQIAALAAAKTLHLLGFSPQIKWPNDLLLDGKKVGGILTELVELSTLEWGVILGIGINLNMSKKNLNQIEQPATSLSEIAKKEWSPDQFLNPFIKELLLLLEKVTPVGFVPLVQEFTHYLAGIGSPIAYRDGNQELHGVFLGISDQGTPLIFIK